MRTLIPLLVLLTSLLSGGCANLNSVYRPLDTGEGRGALIDIKQRAIIAAKPATPGGKNVVCAEPSPDALSAYAAQIAAEASVPDKAAAQLAASFQEGSSFVGLRTQSIQLLRDALYRLCEGYANGALNELQYDILMRRYQKYMVALLGIEQLAGVVRSPAVTISGQGTAEAARALASLRAEADAIDAKIAKLEEQKAAAADAAKPGIDKQIAARKADRDAVLKAIESGRGLLASGSASAAIVLPSAEGRLSAAQAEGVAGKIQKIVLKVIDTDDLGQLCFASLLNGRLGDSNPLNRICADHLARDRKVMEVKLRLLETAAELLKSGKLQLKSMTDLEEFLDPNSSTVADAPTDRPGA